MLYLFNSKPVPRENLSLKADLLLTDWVAVISLAVGFENVLMISLHACTLIMAACRDLFLLLSRNTFACPLLIYVVCMSCFKCFP